jgi:protein phosphatase PTC7
LRAGRAPSTSAPTDRAHAEAARSGTPGASTALVVSLRGATLEWACVGDSAFAVLRGGRVVHRSAPQQHSFNCPYQLSAAGGDRLADADVGEVPVADGDVVVVGTDGLFDNVFDVEAWSSSV